jgi:hypothetical protein
MAARPTGWAMLAAGSVQEAHDLALSRSHMPDPAGFERANYVRTLMSWSSRAQVSPGQATSDEPVG